MRERNGFTLIELLIVVAIIGILAAIAIPNFQAAQVRSRVAHSLSEQRTYRNVHKMYLLDYTDLPGHYDGAEEHCPYVNAGMLGGPLTDPFMANPGPLSLAYWKHHEGRYHNTPISDSWAVGVKAVNYRFWKDWDSQGRPYVIYGEGPACTAGRCNGWVDYAPSNGLLSDGILLAVSVKGKRTPGSSMGHRECK